MKEFLIRGKALGAFNLDSLETLKAVMAAVTKLNAPAIVEVSPGELNYFGMQNIASLVDNAKRSLKTPLFLNIDHGEDVDILTSALDYGFDMIHFDGSKLPLDENITKAKQLVEAAHSKNVLVEGEINPIGQNSTDPEQAKRFVSETGVDIFAVSIGNKHGVGENEKLDLELLQKIRQLLPETFFSLHGGSGISEEDVRSAIKLGVVKVNVNTEMRVAFKQNLDLTSNELAWYKITQPALASVQEVVEEKIRLFGSG